MLLRLTLMLDNEKATKNTKNKVEKKGETFDDDFPNENQDDKHLIYF